VDLLEPLPAGVVERRRTHLFEQLLDHVADAHDLCRLLDEPGGVFLVVVAVVLPVDLDRADRTAVGPDHEHGAAILLLGFLCHAIHPRSSPIGATLAP
jgi:hypothetical protein